MDFGENPKKLDGNRGRLPGNFGWNLKKSCGFGRHSDGFPVDFVEIQGNWMEIVGASLAILGGI